MFYSQDLYDGALTSWSYGTDMQNEYSASRLSRTKHYWKGNFYRLLLTIQEFREKPIVEFRIVNVTPSPKKNRISPLVETFSASIEFEDNTRILVDGYPFHSALRIKGKNAIQVIELFKKHKEAKIKITINPNTVMAFTIDITDYNQNIPEELTSFLKSSQDTCQMDYKKFNQTENHITYTPVSFMDIFNNKEIKCVFNSNIENVCTKKGYNIIKTKSFSTKNNSTQQQDSIKIIYLGHNMLYNNAWLPIREDYSGVKLVFKNKEIFKLEICYDKNHLTKSFLKEVYQHKDYKNYFRINNHTFSIIILNNLIECKMISYN